MSYRVLVVDDSKLARMVMTSALRRIRPDWEAVEATRAEEALDVVAKENVHIALVDFNMPEMDGLKLVERMRKSNPDIPIAIVSANLQAPFYRGQCSV